MSDGEHLLSDVEAFLRRFVAFPSEAAAVASALWAAHAHLLDCFDSTPRIAYLSPEPGSGKTRALEIQATLVPNPMLAVNATTAALFRSISDGDTRPTLLFDEIDTVFGPKAKENEDLRGLLNAGHRRSGVSYRCVGEGTTQKAVAFPSYAALALAGLGELPDTILTRSVIVRMRRRAPHEPVEPYRERLHEPEGHALRARLATWADAVREHLADTFPEMPEGITDRPADVWEPLLMVADSAGGTWPHRARDACVELVAATRDPARASLGVRLLGDLRTVFDGADKLSTAAICARLCGLEDAPWDDLRGKPIDGRTLKRLLRNHTTAEGEEIKPRTVRLDDGSTPKGYHAGDLADAWARYLPTTTTAESAESGPATAPPMASHWGCGGDVAATRHTSATENPPLTWDVSAVADVADLWEGGGPDPGEAACAWCGHPFTPTTEHPENCEPCTRLGGHARTA